MKNNYLIINLRRFGDIYLMGHLINSIVVQDPNAQIFILVYEEFSAAAKTLKNVTGIFTIDRKKIVTLENNKIFSTGLALDSFYKTFKDINRQKWDKIVNFSNDQVSTYVTSFLSTKNHIGIARGNSNEVIYSNKWSMLFNDLLPEYKYSPIHFVDCYHSMLGLNFIPEGQKLRSNPKHNETAYKNISQIKLQQSVDGNEIKIIGIQLRTSVENKNIPAEILVNFIDSILDNPKFYPVLLIAPNEEERNFSKQINKDFDNSLVIVEADLMAVTSVLMNIDALITPDTAIKHVADLLELPCVEVSLGQSPFFKQGSINPNSILLTNVVETRNFKKVTYEDNYITEDDIFKALTCLFNPELDSRVHLSSKVTMYRPYKDNWGLNYIQTAGDISVDFELTRLISREFIYNILEGTCHIPTSSQVLAFPLKIVREFCNKEREAIAKLTKQVLNTLRLLKQSGESGSDAKNFVLGLDALLQFCDTNDLTAISTILFRAQIENLGSISFEESRAKVENFLYELKNNIQLSLSILHKVEETVFAAITNQNTPNSSQQKEDSNSGV